MSFINRPNPRIGWILSGSPQTAGARLQGYLMHETFVAQGRQSTLLFAPTAYTEQLLQEQREDLEAKMMDVDVLVFQKVYGVQAVALARKAQAFGKRVVYIACNLQGHDMVNIADRVIAVSRELKKCFGRRFKDKIYVVEDSVEVMEHPGKQTWGGPDKLRLVYVAGEAMAEEFSTLFTHSPDVGQVHQITGRSNPSGVYAAEGLDSPAHKMNRLLHLFTHAEDIGTKIKSKWMRFRDRQVFEGLTLGRFTPDYTRSDWALSSVADEIVQYDVAVVPCRLDSDWNQCKSANRVSMFMALGMPVIASPLPAYLDLIRSGETGLMASSRHAWIDMFALLRDPHLREYMGKRARESVRATLNPEKVANTYFSVCTGDVV